MGGLASSPGPAMVIRLPVRDFPWSAISLHVPPPLPVLDFPWCRISRRYFSPFRCDASVIGTAGGPPEDQLPPCLLPAPRCPGNAAPDAALPLPVWSWEPSEARRSRGRRAKPRAAVGALARAAELPEAAVQGRRAGSEARSMRRPARCRPGSTGPQASPLDPRALSSIRRTHSGGSSVSSSRRSASRSISAVLGKGSRRS